MEHKPNQTTINPVLGLNTLLVRLTETLRCHMKNHICTWCIDMIFHLSLYKASKQPITTINPLGEMIIHDVQAQAYQNIKSVLMMKGTTINQNQPNTNQPVVGLGHTGQEASTTLCFFTATSLIIQNQPNNNHPVGEKNTT